MQFDDYTCVCVPETRKCLLLMNALIKFDQFFKPLPMHELTNKS